MARTQIPVDVSADGGAVFAIDTAADTTNGNYFINSGRELLFIENTGASSVTVTIDMMADSYGRDGSKMITVPAGEMRMAGPFPKVPYNQPGEQVHVNASGDCDFAVVRA
jgi:hypothetical protein